jgi:hypothetical protein
VVDSSAAVSTGEPIDSNGMPLGRLDPVQAMPVSLIGSMMATYAAAPHFEQLKVLVR